MPGRLHVALCVHCAWEAGLRLLVQHSSLWGEAVPAPVAVCSTCSRLWLRCTCCFVQHSGQSCLLAAPAHITRFQGDRQAPR